jgi:quinoprotein glucose dehydrogenase
MQRRFTTSSRILVWLVLILSASAHAQHATTSPAFDAAAGDARRFQLAPGLKLEVWAAEPQLSNSVAFAFDGKGRVHLAESDRWAISVFDITQHTNWLWQDMSFRNVAERGAFLTNRFATNLAFLTQDSEVVRRVEDRNGDGRADHSEIIATGFTNAVDGTAAGILVTHAGIYFANIPSLWKLSGTGVISRSVISNQSGARPSSTDSLNTDPMIARSLLAGGFGVHIGISGHDLHGLIKGPDGRIYMSFGDRGCVLTNREGVVINLPDTGGVLRCEPDGRDLEVFCYGLRNPQELAFDDLGNLWTVDNDTAGADPCRVLHLVEGGDYGWRTSYQHMDGFGPWVQEELWKGGQDGILPPAGTVSQGPSGLAFHPGTGFGERFAGTFLHADFPGGVWAYTLKPQGASYVVDRKEKLLWNCWPTDVDFGPDGAAYVLDWVSGWGQTPRGRIYRITPNSELGTRNSELVAETRRLLAEGMTQRREKELLDLLGHADRRVRLEAQWELAERGPQSLRDLVARAKKGKARFERIHALWAVEQVVRDLPPKDYVEEVFTLLPLVHDKDEEIQIQAIETLAELRLGNLQIELPRVKAVRSPKLLRHLALAEAELRPIGKSRVRDTMVGRALDALELDTTTEWQLRRQVGWTAGASDESMFCSLINRCAHGDQFERQAGVVVLTRWMLPRFNTSQAFGDDRLNCAATNQDPVVRLLAVQAVRKLAAERFTEPDRGVVLGRPDLRDLLAPRITNFLSDPDPRLIVAAGRAIHDVPIVEGFPALAAFITKIDCPTNLMSRVINACYRLGTQQHAQMLAGFAAREDVPDWARVLALRALADWERPSPLDRVNGLWRPLKVGQDASLPGAVAPSSPTPTASASAPASPSPRPSPGGEGRGEGGLNPRSAIPSNPLLERAAQAQAARNLGRAAELPVLPADLGRSVSYDPAMALRRNPAPAQRAFLRVAGDLMNPFNRNEAGQPAGTREVLPLQIVAAEAAAKLRVKEAGTPLFEKFARTDSAPELRRAILPALAELRSPLTGEAVKLALADPDPKLRATALPYLDRLEGDSVDLLVSLIGGPPTPRPSPPARGGNAVSPSGNGPVQPTAPALPSPSNPTLTSAPALPDSGTRPNASPSPGGEGRGEGGRPADIPLAQAALAALAKLPGAKANDAIRGALAQLEAKQLPAELALDVREAAKARGLVAQGASFPELLVGGNAERGRQVFFLNQTVQCLRCHKVGGDGGIVGPELTGIGKRQSRDYLLESILQPNAKIAAGFENVVLTLNDGSTVAGALKMEADAELAVEVMGEDGLPTVTKVAKSAVKRRERGPGAMPEGLGDQLTPFELRNLVEYLATLK